MAEVAKLLGVELDEEFLVDDIGYKFKINIDGLFFYESKRWWRSAMLPDLLTGTLTIKKLPYEPKVGDYYYYPNTHCIAVGGRVWNNNSVDFALKLLNMVYRTNEEAEKNFSSDYEKLTGSNLVIDEQK